MTGVYDITRFSDGYHDEDVHDHNSLGFIANEHDPARIAALERHNQHLSTLLWRKDIWLALRIWNGFAHDWPVWAHMLPLYIGGHD